MNAEVVPPVSLRIHPFTGKKQDVLKRFAVLILSGGEYLAYEGRRTLWAAKLHARFLEREVGVARALVVDQEEHGIVLCRLDGVELVD